MPAVKVASDNKVIPIVRSVTPPAANATTTYIQRWSCRGKGTIRVFIFSNQAVTLNILQKPKDLSTTSTFAMRQTDTRAIAANATSQAGQDFNVRADYVRVDVVATTAPTTFEIEVFEVP